jgi:hypothetical protein
MSVGSDLAPWLIAFGALMIALAFLTNVDMCRLIAKRVTKNWQRVLVCLIVCCLFFVPTFVVVQNVASSQREALARTPIFYGELTPGDEPTPPAPSYTTIGIDGYPIPSTPPVDCFRVMFGDDSGIYIDGPVNNAFLLRGMPFLRIGMASDGTVILNTEVLDSTGHKIVKIVDNEFQANPEYAFRPRQPDKHSLVVRDSDGVEVLNIKYVNSGTIWISGKFFVPEYSDYATILPSGLIQLGNLQLNHVYSTGLSPGGEIGLGG